MFRGRLIAFAEDTALFYKADSLNQLKCDMQHDLNALRWWFTKSYMVMSPKTKYIIFNISREFTFFSALKYHNLSCNDLNCACPNIEQVQDIKYLGLVVDSKISWKHHVQYLKLKLIKYVRIMYLLATACDKKLLKTVYYSLIHSKLEYSIGIWGGFIFHYFKSHNSVTKIVCSDHSKEIKV